MSEGIKCLAKHLKVGDKFLDKYGKKLEVVKVFADGDINYDAVSGWVAKAEVTLLERDGLPIGAQADYCKQCNGGMESGYPIWLEKDVYDKFWEIKHGGKCQDQQWEKFDGHYLFPPESKYQGVNPDGLVDAPEAVPDNKPVFAWKCEEVAYGPIADGHPVEITYITADKKTHVDTFQYGSMFPKQDLETPRLRPEHEIVADSVSGQTKEPVAMALRRFHIPAQYFGKLLKKNIEGIPDDIFVKGDGTHGGGDVCVDIYSEDFPHKTDVGILIDVDEFGKAKVRGM